MVPIAHEPRPSQPNSPESGILAEKRQKDIETELVDTLRRARLHLTNRELVDLMNRLKVTQGLDGLRTELERDHSLDDHRIPEETVQAIFALIEEARKIAGAELGELRVDIIGTLNQSVEYDISSDIYRTRHFAFVKTLEDSPLGKNPIIDVTGMIIGALDSAEAVFRLLITLLLDIVLLPRDIVRRVRRKR